MCEACDTMINFNPYDEGFEAGQVAEQNRIIALLEAEAKVISDQFADYIESDFIHAIIELIKGENNG